jgi:hypothetical protein
MLTEYANALRPTVSARALYRIALYVCFARRISLQKVNFQTGSIEAGIVTRLLAIGLDSQSRSSSN